MRQAVLTPPGLLWLVAHILAATRDEAVAREERERRGLVRSGYTRTTLRGHLLAF